MVHGLQALAVSIPFSYIHAEILVYPNFRSTMS